MSVEKILKSFVAWSFSFCNLRSVIDRKVGFVRLSFIFQKKEGRMVSIKAFFWSNQVFINVCHILYLEAKSYKLQLKVSETGLSQSFKWKYRKCTRMQFLNFQSWTNVNGFGEIEKNSKYSPSLLTGRHWLSTNFSQLAILQYFQQQQNFKDPSMTIVGSYISYSHQFEEVGGGESLKKCW